MAFTERALKANVQFGFFDKIGIATHDHILESFFEADNLSHKVFEQSKEIDWLKLDSQELRFQTNWQFVSDVIQVDDQALVFSAN